MIQDLSAVASVLLCVYLAPVRDRHKTAESILSATNGGEDLSPALTAYVAPNARAVLNPDQ